MSSDIIVPPIVAFSNSLFLVTTIVAPNKNSLHLKKWDHYASDCMTSNIF